MLAVKIDNHRQARPQTGLETADVVVEERVEGGVTRFIALFQSEVPDRVGPVRSARLVDARVLPAFEPIFGYSGARDEVTAALRRAGLARLTPQVGGVFERDPSRPGSHNLFASGGALYEQGAGMQGVSPPRRPVWPFAEQAPSGGEPTGQLTVRMSGNNVVGWDWDGGAGVWRRSQNGEPTRVTGAGRLGAANVVALGMSIGPGGCCDSAGNPYVHTEVVGEGQGVVLRDGRAYPVRWSKAGPDRHFTLTRPDGSLLELGPGLTWIHLMPAENLPDVAGGASPAAESGR